MPYRRVKAYTDEFYHVYNRGVAKQKVFFRSGDYNRFERILNYYRVKTPPLSYSRYLELKDETQQEIVKSLKSAPKLVKILAYCLMPNHYHLILRQVTNNGITTFIRRSANSYTKYINTRSGRVGPLFQGPYKLKHVATDEQLVHLSKYIHINPQESGLITGKRLPEYHYSSLPQYCELSYSGMLPVSTKDILGYFKSAGEYKDFVISKPTLDVDSTELLSDLTLD